MYKDMINTVKKNIETNIQKMKELDLIIVKQQAQYDLLIYLQDQQDKKLPEKLPEQLEGKADGHEG